MSKEVTEFAADRMDAAEEKRYRRGVRLAREDAPRVALREKFDSRARARLERERAKSKGGAK